MEDNGNQRITGVSMAANLVGGFFQAWMIAYRELFVAVLECVKADVTIESNRLSEKVKAMPETSLAKLRRVDNEPLTRKSWDPHQSRGRFKVN